MRKILFILGLWLGTAVWSPGAQTLTLTDGTSLTGDIIKSDDNGLGLRATGDVYTNVPWGRFSQESLKQLAQNPKLRLLVEVFIEPDVSQRPPKAEIKINPVTRLERPVQPSLFGGLVQSPVGLFILFVLYLANLYAAFEVALFRARPVAQVVGLAAVLPVIAPVVFLVLPMPATPAAVEELSAEGVVPGAAGGSAEEIQIVEASWKQEEKKVAGPQVYARGKFTFNKRFIETKFAGFIGEPKGDGKTFTMEVRTLKEPFAVERIAQITATEVIFETVNGQVVVPFADIQEIKLIPISA